MAGVAFEVATLAQKPKIQKKMASAFMDEVKRDLLVNLAFKKAGDDLKKLSGCFASVGLKND